MAEKAMDPNKKKRNLKLFLQVSFFLILTSLAIYYILKDDPQKTFQALSKAHFLPLVLAFDIVFFAMILLEGFCLKLLTNIFNRQYHYGQGIINTMIGGVVSIFIKTGAPLIQAYTFSKQKVSLPHAASVLTMDFILNQFTMTLYYAVIVILGYGTIKQIPIQFLGDMPMLYLVYICLAVGLIYCVGAILIAYCRPLHRFVLNTGVNILTKLHIIKDPSKYRRRLATHLATYRIEMRRLSHHKGVVFKVLLINVVKLFLMSTIPFFCFYALIPQQTMNADFFIKSLYGTGFIQTVSSLITIGVPEILFQDIFGFFLRGIAPDGSLVAMASAANILWRVTTFYFIFVVGLISYLCYRGTPMKYKILTDTSTIYDLSIMNLDQEDPEIADFLKTLQEANKEKKTETPKLLSRKEVESSFKEMSSQIQDSLNYPPVKEEEKDWKEDDTYQITCADLAKIADETNSILHNQASKEEIEKESRKDLQFQKKKSMIKEMKKSLKAKKRLEQKQAKELEKHQPKGSVVTYDEKTGIQIKPHQFIEIKTRTTSEAEEREKQRKNESQKKND